MALTPRGGQILKTTNSLTQSVCRSAAIPVVLCFAAALVTGCASTPPPAIPKSSNATPPADEPGGECVPYARNHSAIKLFGDAYTWWDQAKNHYARRVIPIKGSVMVLHNYAGASRAHVAVVRSIVNPHEIRVDHANWFNDGKVYRNNPVRDASPNRDWSMVNVYNMQLGAWGLRNYEVQGFIGPDKYAPPNREDDISNLFSNAAPTLPDPEAEIAQATASSRAVGLMPSDATQTGHTRLSAAERSHLPGAIQIRDILLH